MRIPLLEVPVTRWECPSCDHTDQTRVAGPHSRFHPCPGVAGLTAPLVPAGTRCKVVAVEREDYIGDEDVQYDGNGRPVAQLVTVRDSGTDCVVFAPTAHARLG